MEKYNELDRISQAEYKTLVLHLLHTNTTCQNIIHDMLELAEKRGWLPVVGAENIYKPKNTQLCEQS